MNVEFHITKDKLFNEITVYMGLYRLIRRHRPRWVLLPIEIKLFPIIFSLILWTKYKFELLSYNHTISENDS